MYNGILKWAAYIIATIFILTGITGMIATKILLYLILFILGAIILILTIWYLEPTTENDKPKEETKKED